jgi:hypothetical protein
MEASAELKGTANKPNRLTNNVNGAAKTETKMISRLQRCMKLEAVSVVLSAVLISWRKVMAGGEV